ncbi:MAG: hypothetical protein DIU56_003345 [Pseudomonadota bacterium]
MATTVQRRSRASAAKRWRVGCGVLGSLLIHALLFLMPGLRYFAAPGPTTSAVDIRIVPPNESLEAGREITVLPQQQTAERAIELPRPSEALPQERLDERIARSIALPEELLESFDSFDRSEADATEPHSVETHTAHTGIEPAPEPGTPEEESSRIEPVVTTLFPSQEALLARRVMSAASELLENEAAQSRIAFTIENREFVAVLTREPASDGMGIERVTVEVSTDHDGAAVLTRMQMKRLAFSHFTQLVDYWDPRVQMHDDEIEGRFHSNSEVLLLTDRRVAPRLRGKVTSARGFRILSDDGWWPRRKIFAGGAQTRAPRIRLPELSLPVPNEHTARDAEVHALSGDAHLVFHADGGYDRLDVASQAVERRHLAPDRPTYIVGTNDAELHVRGTVNGRVTVYSPRRIVIEGDLVYAHDPREGGESDDYLGLISDGTVEIAPARVTGPGDLEIHAAIYARRRFVVRDLYAHGGTLRIYGSLTSGSVTATEPRYATRIEFDPRFERVRPPGFPETNRYELEAWDGRWRLASSDD